MLEDHTQKEGCIECSSLNTVEHLLLLVIVNNENTCTLLNTQISPF